MKYKTDKGLIYVYDNTENLFCTIMGGSNPGRVMISSYDKHEKVKYPILTIGRGSECIMSDDLTVYFTADREQNDVIQLMIEHERTLEHTSFFLVYNEKQKQWIDFENKVPW
jgi:hypothetical protein